MNHTLMAIRRNDKYAGPGTMGPSRYDGPKYPAKPSGGIQKRSTPEMGKKKRRRRKRKSRK